MYNSPTGLHRLYILYVAVPLLYFFLSQYRQALQDDDQLEEELVDYLSQK